MTANQEFRLLSAFAVVVFGFITPVPLSNQIPIDCFQVLEVIVPLSESGQSMSIGKNEAKSSIRDRLNTCNEVNDGLLPLIVVLHSARL